MISKSTFDNHLNETKKIQQLEELSDEYRKKSIDYEHNSSESSMMGMFYGLSVFALIIIYPLRFVYFLIRWAIRTVKE